jgi:DNA-binding NtrC family response regulator
MSPDITSTRILIVDSSIVERRKLVEAITDSGLGTQIREAKSVAEAKQLVRTANFDLCFIGVGLTEATQRDLIKTASKETMNERCALIPIAKRADKEKVLRYVQSGAHGVLLTPIQPEPLKRVIETAFSNILPQKN